MISVPIPWVAVSSILAFLAGRWSAQDAAPKLLSNVAPEVMPLLYEPPPGHGSVSVPSVKRDARGAVHNLLVGGFRFNVLQSIKGSVRSGDVHRSRQYDMIFSGRAQVTTRERGRNIVREYTSGDLVVIPAFVPHIFTFLNDVRPQAHRTPLTPHFTLGAAHCPHAPPLSPPRSLGARRLLWQNGGRARASRRGTTYHTERRWTRRCMRWSEPQAWMVVAPQVHASRSAADAALEPAERLSMVVGEYGRYSVGVFLPCRARVCARNLSAHNANQRKGLREDDTRQVTAKREGATPVLRGGSSLLAAAVAAACRSVVARR